MKTLVKMDKHIIEVYDSINKKYLGCITVDTACEDHEAGYMNKKVVTEGSYKFDNGKKAVASVAKPLYLSKTQLFKS